MGERTFVMVKPDGVQRGLVGEILHRFERAGLRLVALKMTRLSEQEARIHYAHHSDKPFFPDLVAYVTSGPVVMMVLEGENAVKVVRKLVGATDPAEAEPGTIRGDFALSVSRNLIHASDSAETAEAEIKRFFGEVKK